MNLYNKLLTSREEAVNGPSGIERRQLQTLSQAGQSMSLNGGGAVEPSGKQQVLDQKFVW